MVCQIFIVVHSTMGKKQLLVSFARTIVCVLSRMSERTKAYADAGGGGGMAGESGETETWGSGARCCTSEDTRDAPLFFFKKIAKTGRYLLPFFPPRTLLQHAKPMMGLA